MRSSDFSSFREDIEQLIQEHRGQSGEEDFSHALRFLRLSHIVEWAAILLAAWHLNPVSPLALAFAWMGRWGIAHQIFHRAYEAIPNCPHRLKSRVFGRGWRRFIDWCDWISPNAWQLEHNVHHVNTGGEHDPDVVEANMEFLRSSKASYTSRVVVAVIAIVTWRLQYYAPSTFLQLRRKEQGLRQTTYRISSPFEFAPLFNPLSAEGARFYWRCIAPYVLLRFVVVPGLFLPFGLASTARVLVTTAIAELCFNVWSWMIIASSHTADDLYRFDGAVAGKELWTVQQVLGTCNYPRSPGLFDWTKGWINYQIEHHLAPNLTLLQLERIGDSIELVCRRHGLPYVSESLLSRSRKMFAIVTGKASMKRVHMDR